jgi:ABC-2 type transport system permease protein
MTASGHTVGGTLPAAALEQRIWHAYQTELRKLSAQVIVRLLVLVCVVGPFAFAGVLSVQSGTPADALFGAYVHSTGFAISLVVLGFAGSWGFPLIAGLIAGDIFASEDRQNTWKTILTRSCSLADLFAGKVLAALTYALGLLGVAAVASLVAGALFEGSHGLVGLSGSLLSPGHSLVLTIVSWLLCALPVISYVSLAVLFSVASRNGIVGVIAPIVVALAVQLLDLIGKGVWAHQLFIGSAFTGFYGLFTAHVFLGPLLVSVLVSLVWSAGCLTAAWVILRRRDFLAGAGVRATGWRAPVRVVVATAVVIAALAFAGNLGPTGVTAPRLNHAIATAFSNASLLQQQLLGRTAPAGARLNVQPYCNRRGAKAQGPGDWLCNVYVYLPQPKSVPFQRTNVDYDVSVASDGCFKAQAPPNFIGDQTMREASGKTIANPLFVVYGCFNTL